MRFLVPCAVTAAQAGPIARSVFVAERAPAFAGTTNDSSQLLLEIRRHFLLLQVGGEVLLDRDVDERSPDRRVRGVGVEVLVLDAAGLHRQQDEVALLPVLALALDD